MDSKKYSESVKSIRLLLKSLEEVLNGIKNNKIDQKDIENVRESLLIIKSNARECL
ncbi:hypothetical protein PFJ87_04g01930 [Encephalitozoon hellem]|uniref:Uncharacterized protein n=1 Tax=Encephalitozoon hellem TaxID=27973 RepID=A0A9Q9FBC9_ENCHE|nr:hypothetical protein GPU96_04g07950 [Encephalitozoon hellem]WEL38517.1 hypothetical protein PFJ87_04g01930 [Encephalitozoon hellem]